MTIKLKERDNCAKFQSCHSGDKLRIVKRDKGMVVLRTVEHPVLVAKNLQWIAFTCNCHVWVFNHFKIIGRCGSSDREDIIPILWLLLSCTLFL